MNVLVGTNFSEENHVQKKKNEREAAGKPYIEPADRKATVKYQKIPPRQ